jgi:hypothetical protein
MDTGLFHLEKRIGINLIPVMLASKPVLLNGMQNLCEHQLSSVCPVVPFWLAVK